MATIVKVWCFLPYIFFLQKIVWHFIDPSYTQLKTLQKISRSWIENLYLILDVQYIETCSQSPLLPGIWSRLKGVLPHTTSKNITCCFFHRIWRKNNKKIHSTLETDFYSGFVHFDSNCFHRWKKLGFGRNL